MAIGSRLAPLAATDQAADARREGPFWYTMCGLRVRSDVRLPIAPTVEPIGERPDLAYCRAENGDEPPSVDGVIVAEIPCYAPCHAGRIAVRVRRGPNGVWLWYDSIGTYHVTPDARRVDVYGEDGVDERVHGHMLAGQVAVFVLHELGFPTLHASAVTTDHGAIAFFGPPGQGKSTMAAAFLRNGATLLTDDVLPLCSRDDGVYATPSLPMMKVWRATAECTLGISDELPDVITPDDKKLLSLDGRYAFADVPTKLRSLYVLQRYDPAVDGRTDVTLRTLTRREGLNVLLAQISYGAFLRAVDAARFLPLYARLVNQAPIRVLRYPNGFDYQEAVYDRIMRDLEGE